MMATVMMVAAHAVLVMMPRSYGRSAVVMAMSGLLPVMTATDSVMASSNWSMSRMVVTSPMHTL